MVYKELMFSDPEKGTEIVVLSFIALSVVDNTVPVEISALGDKRVVN
jgi:hypothetical protein